MARDDKETNVSGRELSEREERALARARAATVRAAEAAGGAKSTGAGRWLALVPVTIAVLMFFLMMPRATTPEAIPAPAIDLRSLGETMRADDARARKAADTRLPTDVLAVGSAVRELQAAQTREIPESPERGGSAAEAAIAAARAHLDDALRGLAVRAGWEDDLLTLRAAQMRAFLDEVARYEATGEVSPDLEQLGGGFVRRMGSSGWVDGRRIVLDDAQRRVAFKVVWNALVNVDGVQLFQTTLDEQRALYALYIAYPHPPEAQRAALDAMRRGASTPETCARADFEERRAREAWRADKIRRLGALDPSYPAAYALGVAYYRAGRYDQSVDAFRAWLDAHPDGPYALRARNHLKAALAAYGPG